MIADISKHPIAQRRIDGQVIDCTCLHQYRPFGGCKYRHGQIFLQTLWQIFAEIATAANICGQSSLPLFTLAIVIQIKQSNSSNIPGKIRSPGIVEHFVIIWYYEREHPRLIARQNRSLMIIAALNRALMTTCAVNCRSQVRKMSVYRVLTGDYGVGLAG